MREDHQEKIPKVFISYSHDSPQHKNWVAEFAAKLVDKGIDVTFDRWDLKRGGDVPKYMEQSVAWADRVLMICTEQYVRKADEGKGGVGYEAMIVTGELVKDLGTDKFIPIVRQQNGGKEVPKSMGTRFYVNLSDGEKFDEEFEELLRELHNEPALKKPPIGKNPFAKTPSGNETPIVVTAIPPSIPEPLPDEATYTYKTALEIARQGDLVAWRQLAKQAKSVITPRLTEWKQRWEEKPSKGSWSNDDLETLCHEGLFAYGPLMCMALAGVESGREAFNNQIAVLDEIMFPKAWPGSGPTVIVEFPTSAAYVYQAVHGALCLETDQVQLAIRLAMTRIQRPYESESSRLFENNELIGWPKSLNGSCTNGWKFIAGLSENLNWISKIFEDADSYKASLFAYYLTLNVLELSNLLATGREEELERNGLWVGIPLCSTFLSEEQKRKAYRLLSRNPKAMAGIWEKQGVSTAKMKNAWPKWMIHTQKMRSQLGYWIGELPHKNLFNDLMG